MIELLTANSKLAAGTLAAASALSLAYWWLQPKPLDGFPHNPISGILGDIPELARLIKEEEITVLDYFEILVERHGPVVQVSSELYMACICQS
jgi:hypothetical protein